MSARLLFLSVSFISIFLSKNALSESDEWRFEFLGGLSSISDVAVSPNVYYTGYNVTGPPVCTPWDCKYPIEPFQVPFTRPGRSNLGTSATFGAAIWRDFRTISVGAEYAWLRGAKTHGVGDFFWGRRTASGHVKETTDVHALLANFSAHLPNESPFTPYIGAGAGIGWRSTRFSYSADYDHDPFDAPILPWPRPTPKTTAIGGSSLGIAYQLFAGANYNLTERTYIGARASWLGLYSENAYTPDALLAPNSGAKVHFGALRATAAIGIRF